MYAEQNEIRVKIIELGVSAETIKNETGISHATLAKLLTGQNIRHDAFLRLKEFIDSSL